MKKIFFNLLIFMLLPQIASALQYDFIYDGIYYSYNYDKTGLGVEGEFPSDSPYKGDMIIPDYVTVGDLSLPVISLNIHAFAHSEITSISLPTTLQFISDEVFFNCDMLESIVIPENVFYIGGGCFAECDNLTSVTFPTLMKDNPYGEYSLGGLMFEKCQNLENVILPQDLKGLDMFFFTDCVSLKEIVLPNSLKNIRLGAFRGSGIEKITIPSGVEKIEKEAFAGCQNLSEIVIEDSKTTLSFVDATDRYDEYFFTSEVLKSLYVGRNLELDYWSDKHLGSPFMNLNNVTDFRLGSDVTTITARTYQGLTGLEKLVIPSGVENIGSCAFMGFGINGSKIVECLALTPPQLASDAFLEESYESCKLLVPSGSEELYKISEGWKKFFEDASARELKIDRFLFSIGNRSIKILTDDVFTAIVTDSFGRLIYSGCDNFIEVPVHGIYIIKINVENKSDVFKISL